MHVRQMMFVQRLHPSCHKRAIKFLAKVLVALDHSPMRRWLIAWIVSHTGGVTFEHTPVLCQRLTDYVKSHLWDPITCRQPSLTYFTKADLTSIPDDDKELLKQHVKTEICIACCYWRVFKRRLTRNSWPAEVPGKLRNCHTSVDCLDLPGILLLTSVLNKDNHPTKMVEIMVSILNHLHPCWVELRPELYEQWEEKRRRIVRSQDARNAPWI